MIVNQRKRIFDWIITILLLITILNGVSPQIQISFFGDYLIQNGFIKLIIILLMIILFLIYIKNYQFKFLDIVWVLVVLYLVFDSIYFFAFGEPVLNTFDTYNTLYAWLLVLPFAIAMKHNFSHINVTKLIILFSIPIVLIAFLQYFLNDPLLFVTSPNGLFKVESYYFYTNVDRQVRAFSLFGSALDFGLFIIFCVCILLVDIQTNGVKFGKITLLLAYLFACYITFTRNIYIALTIVLMVHILSRYLFKSYRYSIFIGFLLTLFLITFISIINNAMFTSVIFDTTSMNIRFSQWSKTLDFIANNNFTHFIFGYGYSQDSGFGLLKFGVIDNTYLAYLVNAGLVGFICIVIFIILIFNNIFKKKSKTLLELATLLFTSTIFFINIFNVAMTFYYLVLMFVALYTPKTINNYNK